jgi:hypothetical protein
MMANTLTLLLRGDASDEAARALETLWASFEEQAPVQRKTIDDLDEDDRKAIDPISLAALVVSIPPAALAVWDLADRIKKRKRAQKLIEEAGHLRIERKVETYVVTLEGPKPLIDMTADQVLDLARAVAQKPEG